LFIGFLASGKELHHEHDHTVDDNVDQPNKMILIIFVHFYAT
jgi:hypothetical protein